MESLDSLDRFEKQFKSEFAKECGMTRILSCPKVVYFGWRGGEFGFGITHLNNNLVFSVGSDWADVWAACKAHILAS
jgi:hypothetical protein